jgi:Cd(II)/Pb(II)-responsive transcriptional regulator
MQIGELARRFNVPVETLRYYEQAGLLKKPARTAGKYRKYADEHAQQLAFILNCRSLDMSHDEIRQLLKVRNTSARDCAEVNAVLDGHIAHVTRRISELKRLLLDLSALRDSCAVARSVKRCEILSALNGTHAMRSKGRSRNRKLRALAEHQGPAHLPFPASDPR